MKLAPVPGLAALSPANFAIVMATGILSVAAHQQGLETLAFALVVLGIVAWLSIAALALARLVLHRAALLEDLRSHQRAPAFFTGVAGTGVLATALSVLGCDEAVVIALACVAAALWAALTYGILAALIVRQDKPRLEDGIGGAWLLAVVATQSISVSCALLAAHAAPQAQLALDFTSLSLWLCGGMLYVWLITLIFYRHVFLRFAPDDMTPTYWINMGAMAISALAGSQLVLNAQHSPFLGSLLPFIEGGTVLYWATGTWWLPLLVVLAVWRYVYSRFPLRYDPGYWGAVFPLGMYSAATHQMSHALALGLLAPVSRVFFWLGMAAWLAAGSGLVRRLARRAAGS